ncbi:MAG: hypothetical protein K2Q12_07890 [Rickettsiales bacterium]|nr:hypothetical protein [Rickettsiales bacterium]
MADSYFNDPSFRKPRVAERIGGALARIGRFTDGVVSIVAIPLNGTLSLFSSVGNWFASIVGMGGNSSGLLTSFEIGAGGLAGITAAGSGIKALDAVAHGEGKRALSYTIRGATEAGVVMINGLTMGLGEIASLVTTGKFLSTNAGDLAQSTTDHLLGLDRPARAAALPLTASPASISMAMPAPMMNYAMPMQQQIFTPTAMAPTMMAQPVMMPQPTMMPPVAAPVMAAPVMSPPTSPAPAGQWTALAATQGHSPLAQQTRTLAVEPRNAQGFTQAVVQQQAAAATQTPTLSQT